MKDKRRLPSLGPSTEGGGAICRDEDGLGGSGDLGWPGWAGAPGRQLAPWCCPRDERRKLPQSEEQKLPGQGHGAPTAGRAGPGPKGRRAGVLGSPLLCTGASGCGGRWGGCWPEPGPGSDRWVPGLCILPRFLRRRPRVPVAEHVDGTFGRCRFRRSEVSHPRQAGGPRRPGTLLSRSQAPAPPFLPGSPWPLDLCRNEDSTSGLDALSRGQLTPGTPLGPPPPALALESLGRKQCKL